MLASVRLDVWAMTEILRENFRLVVLRLVMAATRAIWPRELYQN
jgi:hypothetical protein